MFEVSLRDRWMENLYYMKLTKIKGANGSIVTFQYDENEIANDNIMAASRVDDLLERTKNFREGVTEVVTHFSETIIHMFDKIQDKLSPEQVTLEFGLQVGGEAGFPFVTKGTAQANVKVNITWNVDKIRDAQKVTNVT